MFIYLSKKIAIPNGILLKCVSWNKEQGWIACGGENGLLKVLKLETTANKDPKLRGVAAPSNLSMNQTLEGHNGAVMVVTWNDNYRKLTTSDQYGLIIVWMLHKGMWFEEMINNRNKSVVRDMAWTADGQKICIIYEDGAVIVGSVDGNRLWGKELRSQLAFVEWSPDGRNIIFGTTGGEVHVYDNNGSFLSKIQIYCLDDTMVGVKLVGIDWYDGGEGYADNTAPTLAIAYENGRIQLMRQEADENPIIIDTGMRTTKVAWNTNGTVMAAAGSQVASTTAGEQREVSMVQFYNHNGIHLRTMKVPGNGISSLSWEGGGLRIALAVDSFIYFANIRPDYKWASFGSTIVYAFNKPERTDACVIFWNHHSNEKHVKYIKRLVCLRAAGDHCVMATKAEENSGQYILHICNAIGSPVDAKYIDIEPICVTMTKQHVIVTDMEVVYVWQYRTATRLTSMDNAGVAFGRKESRERIFHIEEHTTSQDAITSFDKLVRPQQPTNDPITACCASDKLLIVARESGTVHRYSLPRCTLEQKYILRCRPQQLALNCNSTRMSIIDINGVLTFFDFEERQMEGGGDEIEGGTAAGGGAGTVLRFERKDTWDMLWSEDNPELFAMMEKTRMYIFRGLNPEEPVSSSGYLCSFSDLRISSVMMDDLMKDPENPTTEMMLSFEAKSLRDTQDILAKVGLAEAYQFVEDHSHPRLWRLIAEAALEKLDFNTADKAFVRCEDYQGIQFLKKLRKIDDQMKQKAEVFAYFRRFDDAERIYREIDRVDLAIDLRIKLGDWFRLAQLAQSSSSIDDTLQQLIWTKMGEYYADRQKWSKACHYFAQAKNYDMLSEAYYMLEDYAGLQNLVQLAPEGSPLLEKIGTMFSTVGITESAVAAYLKEGNVKAAIDTCVLLNEWDQAVSLAEEHNFQQIEGLLTKYASHLLEGKKVIEAIELYRKANKHTEAAQLLSKLAEQAAKEHGNPLLAKKLYVLSALEVEKFRKKMFDAPDKDGGTRTAAQTLDTLLQHDTATVNSKILENAWKGAEAYHFWLMAQRQLYQGQVDDAMRTSVTLQAYEEYLDKEDIYRLMALTCFYNKHYGQCSKAFIHLENLPGLPAEKKKEYSDLALAIFTKYAPKDPVEMQTKKSSDGFICVATGRIGSMKGGNVMCRVCKHRGVDTVMGKYSNCPLCHSLSTWGIGTSLYRMQ